MSKATLSKVISDLRQELYAANEAGKGEDLQIVIEAVDVELSVEIAKGGDGDGKLSFNVAVLGAEIKAGGEYKHTQGHKIVLHLKPEINGQRVPVKGSGRRDDD